MSIEHPRQCGWPDHYCGACGADERLVPAAGDSLPIADAVIALAQERGSDKVTIDRLQDYLESEGYRRCYTPECNCGWWLPGNRGNDNDVV